MPSRAAPPGTARLRPARPSGRRCVSHRPARRPWSGNRCPVSPSGEPRSRIISAARMTAAAAAESACAVYRVGSVCDRETVARATMHVGDRTRRVCLCDVFVCGLGTRLRGNRSKRCHACVDRTEDWRGLGRKLTE